MAKAEVKTRSAAKGTAAERLDRRGSDPVGETLPAEDAPTPSLSAALKALLEADLALKALEPQVSAANARYDAAKTALDEALVEAELKSAGEVFGSHRIAATLSEREVVKVAEREKLLAYVKKYTPGLLTVNTQTVGAWFRNDAPSKVQHDPASVGLVVDKLPILQVRITPAKA